MESLAGYSSDDSSLGLDHVPEASSSSKNSQTFDPIELITAESCQNSDQEDFSNRNQANLPQIPLLPYLQEYSMNTKRQVSAFTYLPWAPSREFKNRLQKAGNLAKAVMKTKVPNFDKRFTCNLVISSKSVAHGIFGFSNTRSFTDLHVSLFPNIRIPEHKLKQLTGNIQRAVKDIPVPPQLLHKKTANALDLMLMENTDLEKKELRFQLDGNLRLYKLTKLGLLFVGVGVSKFADKESRQVLPQFEYLSLLTRAIEEEAKMLDASYSWLQFRLALRKDEVNDASLYYHFTLMICELNPLGQRMSDPEFVKLRSTLADVDASKFLRDVYIDVDCLDLRTSDKVTKLALF